MSEEFMDNKGNGTEYEFPAETKEEKKRVSDSNRRAVWSVVLSAIMIAVFFLGYFCRNFIRPDSTSKADEIIRLIYGASIYADADDPDEVARQILKTFLKDDQYAVYYTAEEFKKLLAEDAGNFSGIGFSLYTDGTVAFVFMNSPAYKAGISAGDRFYAGRYGEGESAEWRAFSDVAEERNRDLPESERLFITDVIFEYLSGFGLNEEIDIMLERVTGSSSVRFDVAVEKTEFTVSYVEYYDDGAYFFFSTEEDGFKGRTEEKENVLGLSEDTAYIKLYEFNGGASSQFSQALDFMRERGKSKLILDLRNNGGGLLNILTDIASCLINDNGKANLKVLGVEEKNRVTRYTTGRNNYYDNITAVSVIANKGTASASESLIGALMAYGDRETKNGAAFGYDKLILTSDSTYGKGIMQTTYRLTTGGAFKLTTAKIYWPEPFNTVCVQDVGVTLPEDYSQNRVTDAQAISKADEVLR